jgi:RNA polymerase sigma-70 factor (ECF subfamily)
MAARGPLDVESLIARSAGLRRLAVRLVGESDADDVVQDALVAGMQHAPRDERALTPWLVRVVRNFAAGRHRGEGRRAAREMDTARREALPSASDLVERMEVQRVVAEEVLRLADPYRTAVLAVYFEGVGAEKYARGLGVPSATVRSWLKRGLEQLRMRLDGRFGGDRGAWSACLIALARPEYALVPVAIVGGLMLKYVLFSAAAILVAALVFWKWTEAETPGWRPETVAEVVLLDPVGEQPRASTAEMAALEQAESRSEIAVSVAASTSSVVRGRVVWSPDRAPAVGIGVRLSSSEYRPDLGEPPFVLTDADGRYSIEVTRTDWYELGLDRQSNGRRIRLTAGEVHEADLELTREVAVSGRVLTRGGTPVADAEVCMGGFWPRCVARSAPDGSYSIEGVRTSVFARAPGFSPSGAYDARPAGLFPEPVSSYTVDLYLGGPSCELEGYLLDSTGQPMVGVHLAASAPEREKMSDPRGVSSSAMVIERSTTDANGAFAFRDLRAGQNVIRVHYRQPLEFSVACHVRPGRVTRMDIAMPALVRLAGQVTSADGSPVPGAYINAYRTDGVEAHTWQLTDAQGRYDSALFPAGRVRLMAHQVKFGPTQFETELAPGEEHEWSPVLGTTSVIRGRVVDVEGRGLSGIQVTCSPGKGTEVLTDGEGRFELISKRNGVNVVAQDFENNRAERWGVLLGDENVELVLEKANASIRGRLVDSSGRALPNAALSCQGMLARAADELGRFEYRYLKRGEHDLYVSLPDVMKCRLLHFTIQEGETKDVGDVRLPAAGTLVVKLRAHDGVDPFRTELLAHRTGAPLQVLTSRGSNAGGDWTVEGVPEGEYRLSAVGGNAALVEQAFVIRAGETTFVEAELHAGRPLRVEVLGERVAPWVVEILDESGAVVSKAERLSEHEPASTVIYIRPGPYELRAKTNDGRTGRTLITLVAHTEREHAARIEVH